MYRTRRSYGLLPPYDSPKTGGGGLLGHTGQSRGGARKGTYGTLVCVRTVCDSWCVYVRSAAFDVCLDSWCVYVRCVIVGVCTYGTVVIVVCVDSWCGRMLVRECWHRAVIVISCHRVFSCVFYFFFHICSFFSCFIHVH